MNLAFKLIFLLVDLLWLRKNKHLWVIGIPQTDRFDGNVRALYELAGQSPDVIAPAHLKIILPAGSCPEVAASDRVNWGSWAHFSTLLRAGCILFHHNYNDVGLLALPIWRTNVRVSHGIHYKCVERAQAIPSRINTLLFATRKTIPHHLVSSKLDAMSAVAYFHLYLPNIVITGAAKNDILIQDMIPKYYQTQQSQLDQALAGRRLITYAPTWRTTGNSYPWNEDEVHQLRMLLNRTNAVLGVAGHQYLRNRHIPEGEEFIDLNALQIDVQVILRRTDVLISDYSSIWIDFLLKEKPIVLFQYDRAEYLSDRGILFDTDVFSPQTQCTNFAALMQALKYPPEPEPVFLRRAFHKYDDGKNGVRNFAAIRSLIEHQ